MTNPADTASETFTTYERYAVRATAKAAKARRRMLITLSRVIPDVERQRITEAVAGVESGLRSIGKCRECSRTLTDPESVASGIGPDCAARIAAGRM